MHSREEKQASSVRTQLSLALILNAKFRFHLSEETLHGSCAHMEERLCTWKKLLCCSLSQ